MDEIEKVEEVVEIVDSLESEEKEDLETQDDGTLVEVYRDKRTGNIVTHPKLRSPRGGTVDPRQQVCWDAYVKGWRAGIPNAQEAARIAGYAPNSCANITNQKWFRDKKDTLRRSKMMSNAERNISRILNLGLTRLKKLEDGSEEEVFDIDKARIVADMSKLIVTTLGKDSGYSSKTEVKVTALPSPILQLDVIDIETPLLESNEPTIE